MEVGLGGEDTAHTAVIVRAGKAGRERGREGERKSVPICQSEELIPV